MVKIPQSYLGYCVDGVVVRVPAHQRSRTSSGKQLSLSKGLDKTSKKSAKSTDLRASRVRERHNAEDLKVEVKRGNLLSVLAVVEGMMDQKYKARNSFRRFVDCLFTRNIEQRPAIYFAALTGRTDIVRLFLCLLIMDRCNVSNKRNLDGNKSLTLQQWLDKLGYIDGFRPEDMEVCILNALNEETRHVMRSKKFNLRELWGYGNSICLMNGSLYVKTLVCRYTHYLEINYHYLFRKTRAKPSSTKPGFRVGKGSDRMDESTDYLDEDQDYSEYDDPNWEDSVQLPKTDGNESPCKKALYSNPEDEDVAMALALSLSVVPDQQISEDDMIELATEQSLRTANSCVSFDLLDKNEEEVSIDVTSGADFVVVEDAPELVNGDHGSSSSDCWDVVSTDSSFTLVSGKPMVSYRSALLSSVGRPEMISTHKVKLPVPPMAPLPEERATTMESEQSDNESDLDNQFMDDVFIMEGVKGGRSHTFKA